jgi:V/A-type H+-transporting ATPase subunit I
MYKVRVVAVKDQSQIIFKKLQELGVLHVEESSELTPLDREKIEAEKNKITKALNIFDDILSNLSAPQTVLITKDILGKSIDDVISETQRIYQSISSLTVKYDHIKKEYDDLQRMGSFLDALAKIINLPLKDLQYSGNYIFSNVVLASEESQKVFQERAGHLLFKYVVAPAGEAAVSFFMVAASEHKKEIETLIKDLGLTILKIPVSDMLLAEFINQNDQILRQHRSEMEILKKEIQKKIQEDIETIALFREALSTEFERFSVLQQASEARYVTLIEGWIPEKDLQFVTDGLNEAAAYAYIESKKPSITDEPPTKLKNPTGIKPFEVIVKLFSLPKYGDWDPTPSVAYFFAFFFGLMLNDMVYAAGLLLIARFFLDKLVEDPDSEGTQLFRKVLYISGSAALVLGIISGTYLGDFFQMFFGIELKSVALFEAVQQQLADPISFIVLALIIGLIHLNIAHILGMLKGVKEKDWGIVISKIGLFLVQIFGIPFIFKAMLNISIFPLSNAMYSLFMYPMFLGLILIIAGAFIQMGALGAVFWIFDLTGILGDVMSYSRLAGVGLATFYLASSFNLLSDWVASTVKAIIPGMAGAVFAFIIGVLLLLLFHVFNLFLSSLAAFIHSLRLCFVEFLLKFYEGGGREYSPFHLKVRKEITVGKKS